MTIPAILDEKHGPMERSRFSKDLIVYTLGQVETRNVVGDFCRQLDVSKVTLHSGKKIFAHRVRGLRQVRPGGRENRGLKKLVLDLA